jgi:hypothetical protein
MNERTIQLYKQAVDFAYTTAGEDAGKGTVVEGLTAGKFAELIVEECARRAEAYAYMSPNFTALAEELRRMNGVE